MDDDYDYIQLRILYFIAHSFVHVSVNQIQKHQNQTYLQVKEEL